MLVFPRGVSGKGPRKSRWTLSIGDPKTLRASYLKRYVTFSISTKPELLLTDLRPMDRLNDTTALWWIPSDVSWQSHNETGMNISPNLLVS
jgi:hypothetical protein